MNKEFPSYDKNSDGKLSKAEFGAWMFALRKASDPSLKDDAANKTYVAGAFTTADTDKSKSVSKDELTNYLVQGQKNAPAPAPAPAPRPGTSARAGTCTGSSAVGRTGCLHRPRRPLRHRAGTDQAGPSTVCIVQAS